MSRTRKVRHVSRRRGRALQCVKGVVRVLRSPGVGAVIGQIRPEFGAPIPFRQVIGPAGGPIPITAVNGAVATVCGRFISRKGVLTLLVKEVIPEPGPAPLLLPLFLMLALNRTRPCPADPS